MTEETPEGRALDRLRLAKRVFEQNEAFRAREDLFVDKDGGWTHAYVDHDAIVTYLLLTCFDILGPKNPPWLTFGDWLEAAKARERREEAAKDAQHLGAIEAAKVLHRAYLQDYGTTQGFFRFVDEVLSVTARDALLYSVRIWHHDSDVEVEGEQRKKRFLFDLRNEFTHSGFTYGSHAHAMMPTLVKIVDERLRWGWEPIRHDGAFTYGVRRWPFVLFETLFGVLGAPVDDNYDIEVNAIVEPSSGPRRYFKNLPYAFLRDIPALLAVAKE